MSDPLASLRRLIRSPADGVRWACVLEATSPKAGNVYPGRSFSDLRYLDFIKAADITADSFADSSKPICQRMRLAVQQTQESTGTNVNLGMILLMGPLVAADENMACRDTVRDARGWLSEIGGVLDSFTPADGAVVFATIRDANAGGLQTVDSMDVQQTDQPIDLIEAMRLAEARDRVAKQYATRFSDLITQIVPVLWRAIRGCGDTLGGIATAQVELLRSEPDSLIARKNGDEIATSVQRRAQKVDLDDPQSLQRFDDSLRSRSHKLNPGTTADLIAAAMYLILRTPGL